MSDFYVGQVSEHVLIFNGSGEVLVLRHAGKGNPALRGKYHLPGGRMEQDDQPGKGLLREIAEETGLTGVELILPCSTSRWGFDDPVKYSVAYLAKVSGKPAVTAPEHEDHLDATWLPWREILDKEFIHPRMTEVVRTVCEWAVKLGVAS